MMDSGNFPDLVERYQGGGMQAGHMAELLPLLMMLLKGRGDGKMVRGAGNGRSDDVPAYAGGGAFDAPVRLSDGEYVIPADVVSAFGKGSSDAGARELDRMVEDRRKSWRKEMGAFDGPRKG